MMVAGVPVHKQTFCDRLGAVSIALGREQPDPEHLPVQIKHFFSLRRAWPDFMAHHELARGAFDVDGTLLLTVFSKKSRRLVHVNDLPPTDIAVEAGQILECEYRDGLWHPILILD